MGSFFNFYYNILGSELQDGDIWDLADTKKDIYSLWDRCPFYYAYLLILDGWNGGADEILDQNNGTGGSTCIPMKTE